MTRRKNTFPLHIEQMMINIYGRAMRRLGREVVKAIKAKYREEHHNLPSTAIRADESFKEMINRLVEEYTDYLTSKGMQNKIERAEQAIRAWSFKTVSDSMNAIKDLNKRDSMMLAIEQATDSPFIQQISEDFIKKNMEMVELAGKEYVSGIADTAMNAFTTGRTLDELSKDLEDYTDGDVAKAEFWAADLLGDSYAGYTEGLYNEAGIDYFIWRTCGDNAVRESHQELEGRTFSVARGVPDGTLSKPGAKLPGQDYRCRCVMEPTMEPGE